MTTSERNTSSGDSGAKQDFDPRETDHPAGEQDAADNEATESDS